MSQLATEKSKSLTAREIFRQAGGKKVRMMVNSQVY